MSQATDTPSAAGEQEDNPFSFKHFLNRKAGGEGDDGGRKRRGKGKGSKESRVRSPGGEPPPLSDFGNREEGGESEENPFSFKKFVAKKTKDEGSDFSNSSEDDSIEMPPVVSVPDVPSQKPAAKQRSQSLFSTAPMKSKKTQKRKETRKNSKTALKVSARAASTSFLPSFDDSDSGTDPPLPFPNPHPPPPTFPSAVISDPLGALGLESEGLGLLTIKDTVPLGEAKGLGRGGGRGALNGARVSNSSASSFEDIDNTDVVRLGGVALAEEEEDDDLFPEVHTTSLVEELEKLRSENERLRKSLRTSQEESHREKERTKSLKVRLKKLKKKEAEDTKALEDMVLRVEENLVTTTKRAASAEATIARLKQEVQSLRTQLSSQTPQQYEEMMRGVREKASFASQQLNIAALQADQSIRDLLSGVDTLKNVSQILHYIDSISTVPDK